MPERRPDLSIEDISIDRLRDMERRYVERGVTTGGPHSLYEIRIELRRRLPSDFDVRKVASTIIELARASPTQLTTYKAVWDALLPGRVWKGNHSQQILANAFGKVIAYCHRHQLPVLTALVVNGSMGTLTDKAVFNIANECRELGMNTEPNDRAFVERQAEEARAIALNALPAEPMA
jgi:hypothetical protein